MLLDVVYSYVIQWEGHFRKFICLSVAARMSPRLLIGHEEDSKWAREEVPISTNQKFMVVMVVGGSTTHFSD